MEMKEGAMLEQKLCLCFCRISQAVEERFKKPLKRITDSSTWGKLKKLFDGGERL